MECEFKGSPLQHTLQRTNNIEHMYKLTRSALKEKPESVFWNEAFKLIETKYIKLGKKKK